MKKIFTFIFCAVLAISSWGTEVSVTIPTSGATTTADFPITLTRGTFPNTKKVYQSITQEVYLASEIGATNAGTIKSISFKSSNYSASGDYVRDIIVYMQETDKTELTSFISYSSTDKVYENKSLAITSGGDVVCNNLEFQWSGNKNVIITVVDQSKYITTSSDGKKFIGYTPATNGRGIAQTFDFDHIACEPYATPTILNTIAQVTFTIDASGSTTPSLQIEPTSLNFGSYYPEAETASQTFNVTASNLTEDITLSTTAAGVTITPNVIAKDDADLAGDGVEVTVTLGENYAFVGGTKLSVSSDGASTKEITLSATKIVDANFSTQALNMISSDGYYIVDSKVTISSMNTSEKSMLIQSVTTKNANYAIVEGRDAFAVGGNFSGLKGKYKDGVFTIFSYSSYEGTPTSVITIKEDADNSEILADEEENANVTLNRAAFQKNMFNTFCVPFDINEGLIGIRFAGCDIITLAYSEYNDGVISLKFEECTHMEAGKPYLINPKDKDIAFTFNGCNIQNVASGSIETNLVDFIGIVNPTYLPQSKEILFMGQNNELFWPTEAGTLNGMRCYFKVKFEGTPEGSAIAGSPVRMSIINSDGTTTDLPTMWAESNSPMIMYKNQLFVIKDNKLISISGQTIQ